MEDLDPPSFQGIPRFLLSENLTRQGLSLGLLALPESPLVRREGLGVGELTLVWLALGS